MEAIVERLVACFERGELSRRQLIVVQLAARGSMG
jgi:hypothetical protein